MPVVVATRGASIRTLKRVALLVLIPIVAALAVMVHTHGEVASYPDSGVYIGLAHNLRVHGSLTSPADPVWLLMSPANVAARKGFIPIPDFAPIYPVTGAATTDPRSAFTGVGVVAVALVLAMAGLLVSIGTGSTLAGFAMQAVLIVGPLSRFLVRITLLDLGSVIQSDVLALALFLAGLCALLVPTRRYGRSVVVAGGILLALACLTRYAYVGAVIGTAIVLIAQWRRTRAADERDRAIAASVALIAAPVWIIGYQFLTHSGPAKQFHVHVTEVGLIGRIVLAWFGPDIHNTTVGTAVVVILLAGAVALAIRATDTFVRVCAGTLMGYLAVHILTRQFLDASFAYAGERTLLLVRVLLLALVAVLIVRGVKGLRNPRVGTAFVAALLAIWLAVGGTSLFSAPLTTELTARTRHQLNPQRLPLLSNFADITYAQLGQPAIGLPTAVEYSTDRRLNMARQAADLVAVLRRQGTRFLVLVPSLLVQPVGPDQWPHCVRTKRLRTIAGTQRYELDINRCSAQ